MLILLWALLSVVVFVAIDMLSFAFKRTGWDRFLATFLFFYSQIILTEFILGFFSILNPLGVVLLNVAISGALFVFLFQRAGKTIFVDYAHNALATAKTLWHSIKTDKLWLALLIVAGLLIAWIGFLGILFPATDFDGNSYHLTFVGYVIQNQNFYDFPTSLGWLTGYPKGGEFIQLWNVLIANDDTFVDLAQIPFVVLGIAALYQISRRLGVDARHARFTSLLFLFLPVVLNQLKTTYIDVMLCALFFAAIAVVIKVKMKRLDFILLGIIFSLLIAIKYTGFLFVIALVPLLFWNLYVNREKAKKRIIKNYIQPLLLILAPTFFGFYWYIKNFVLYGNPLYPFGLNIGGVSIFPGKTFQDLAAGAITGLKDLPAGCVDRIWFVWTEQKDWFGCLYNYDANYTGLGPIWFIILVPAFIVSLYFIIKFKNRLYFAIAGTVLAVFAVYPINYYSRYTMFITALGIISLGIVMTYIKPGMTRFIKFILILLAISVFATNFVLCNFPPSVIKDQIINLRSGNSRGAAYANTLGSSYIFLQNVMQPGETVAYDSSPYFIYPLWKPGFTNRVIYIPAESKTQWLERLKSEHVRYVFTNIGSKEYGWLNSESTTDSVYKDTQNEIYKIY